MLEPEQADKLVADGHLKSVYREEIKEVVLAHLDENYSPGSPGMERVSPRTRD